jgi:hypothetical protein
MAHHKIHYTRTHPNQVTERAVFSACGFGRPGGEDLTREREAVTCRRCLDEIARLGPMLGHNHTTLEVR